MREKVGTILEGFRDKDPRFGAEPGEHHGLFFVKHCGVVLMSMSSGIDPDNPNHWEHVSISVVRVAKGGKVTKVDRAPTWNEMCVVKSLFWEPEETVIQFHPPESKYVNVHPNCLHLWKPPYAVPTPPSILIG